MTSTSSTTIVIDQIGAAFAADRGAMALKKTETSATAIAQPAPLYTAKAAMSWGRFSEHHPFGMSPDNRISS